jgi:hypothetical protein
MGNRRRSAALAVLILVPALLAPAASAQEGALFEWSMPPRYGLDEDEDRRIDTPRPDQVVAGPWTVELSVAEPACAGGAVIRWAVDGNPVEPKRVADCRFEHSFPAEGSYAVRIDIALAGRRLSETQQVVVQDWLIVSLGDSVASGEAVPDVPDPNRALWQSQRCHRSAKAAPAKAALDIESGDDHTSVTFVHLACSGATVPEGLLGSYAGIEPPRSEPALPPQVDVLNELADRRQVDAVLVSIGANDVHFSDIVKACATPHLRNCLERDFRPEGATTTRPAQEVVADALRELEGRYDDVNRALDPSIQRSRLHLVEYFDPTRDQDGNTCRRILAFITQRDLDAARTKLLEPLQRAVADAAARNGWTAVGGIAERFRAHGYCARGSAWVTTALSSFFRQGGPVVGRIVGTLHPNEAGHNDTAQVLAESLRRTLYPEGVALMPGQRAPAAEDPPEPPSEDGDEGGLSWWAWVLIVLGAAVVLAALAVLLRWLWGVGLLPLLGTSAALVGLGVVLSDTAAVAAPLVGAGALGIVAVPLFAWRDRRERPRRFERDH